MKKIFKVFGNNDLMIYSVFKDDNKEREAKNIGKRPLIE